MAGILEYDTTAGNNTAINSIGILGSDAVLNFDNALRQLMADLASQITRRTTKSANYTALKADHKKLFEFTAAATLSLTAAATLTDGWCCIVKANGGAVIIDPSSSETIDGAATKTVADGDYAMVFCNGSAFFTIGTPAKLATIASLAVTDGNFIVGNGTTWVAESGATVRASLGLVIGTDVQAYDAELAAIAGLTSAADRLPYFTGSGTAALATFTAAGRALVDDADAAAQRTTLGLAAIASSGSADDLSTGAVPSARISGSYTGITGTGALNAGSITSGFGSINVGSSSITTTGAITGGTVTATSDRRIKENIANLSGAIDILAKLQGVYFQYTGKEKRHIGLIAQDVQKVLPEVVEETESGLYAISYGNLTALLVEAVKEISERLDR